MKQKYLADGRILLELNYKGIYYSKEFTNKEELNSFLESL